MEALAGVVVEEGRAPAAPGVERGEKLRLDVKYGKRSGRRRSGRGSSPLIRQ